MRQIGLMGGSFNPIHMGHLHMARAALESGLVEQVLFLPTGNPPHKHAELADKYDRLRMVELAVQGQPGMAVCREEIDREGVIYTVDTLARLAEQMPDCRFVYLIGADTLHQLGTWRRVEEVIRRCAFGVLLREGEPDEQARELAAQWMARGAQITFLQASKVDISSTALRRRAALGLSLTGLTPPQVEAYIHAHGLYGAAERMGDSAMKREKILYRLKKTLDAQRYAHVLGVEKTACDMARRFGEDVEKASLAGLLHDCAKCMTLTQMLKAAQDVPVDPLMAQSKALMHAVAGMCVAQSVYDVKDEAVLSAIRWHTTGHANMTRLEKIIYLADMVEPTRKVYPGLAELRKLCNEDLEHAMHCALRMSYDYVRQSGTTMHPDTLAALRVYEPELH